MILFLVAAIEPFRPRNPKLFGMKNLGKLNMTQFKNLKFNNLSAKFDLLCVLDLPRTVDDNVLCKNVVYFFFFFFSMVPLISAAVQFGVRREGAFQPDFRIM